MKTPQTDDIARGNHVVPTEWAQQLERERDEAMEKHATEATVHMLAINKICNQRDEAVEALMKIEDLFIDGADVYADREKMGCIAIEALKEAQ